MENHAETWSDGETRQWRRRHTQPNQTSSWIVFNLLLGKATFSLKVGVCATIEPNAVGDSWSQEGKSFCVMWSVITADMKYLSSSCSVPVLFFKQPSHVPLRGFLPFGEVLNGNCWWRWALGSEGQLGEPCVNWLTKNQILAEKNRWSTMCHRALWVERASRDQLPFPSLWPDLYTLAVPDKCLFKSVQFSQKISMVFLIHICLTLDTLYSNWSLSSSR